MSIDQRRQKQDRQLRPRVVRAEARIASGFYERHPEPMDIAATRLLAVLEADGAAPTREQEDDERFDADFGVLNH